MNEFTLVSIALGISVLSLIWLGTVTFIVFKQQQLFKEVTQGISKKDIKTILQNLATSLKRAGTEIERVDGSIHQMMKLNQNNYQKFGFVRYNPFSDTGGDQSFCLCLLDGKDNGIVITSLHSRDQTRIYAKPINKGVVKGYDLSKEEQQVLKLALNSQ